MGRSPTLILDFAGAGLDFAPRPDEDLAGRASRLAWRFEAAAVETTLLAVAIAPAFAAGGVEGWALYPCWIATLICGALTVARAIWWDGYPFAVQRGRVAWSIALLLALTLGSALAGIDPALSIEEWWRYAHLVLLGLIIRRRLCGPGDLARLARFAGVAGGAIALYGIVETLGGQERVLGVVKTHYVGELTGTFLNHSHCAAWLCMALPLSLALARRGSGAFERAIHGLCCAAMALAIVLTQSRAAWLALPAASVLVLGLSRRLPRARTVALLTGLLVLVAAALACTHSPRVTALWDRARTIAPGDPETAGLFGRLPLWIGTARIAIAHPLLGTGPATYEYAFLPYRPRGYFYALTRAHGDLLEACAECGLPATILLVLLLSTLLARIARRARGPDPLDATLATAVLAGLTSVILHSFVDFVFHVPAIPILFVSLLAVSLARKREGCGTIESAWTGLPASVIAPSEHAPRPSDPRAVPPPASTLPRSSAGRVNRVNRASRVLIAVIIVAGTVIPVQFLTRWTLASLEDLRGRLLQRSGDVRGAVCAYRNALDGRPDARRILAHAASLALNQARASLQHGDEEGAVAWALNATRLARALTDSHPLDAAAWLLEGRASGLLWMARRHRSPALAQADVALAQACLARAVRADPHHHEAAIALGNLLFAMGRNDEALAAFDEALRRYPSERIGIFPEITCEMAPAAQLSSRPDLRSMDEARFRLGIAILMHRRRLAPDDFRPLYDLQIIYARRGLMREAAQATRALEHMASPGAR